MPAGQWRRSGAVIAQAEAGYDGPQRQDDGMTSLRNISAWHQGQNPGRCKGLP
jgi:hypothetical protein